MEKLVVANWKLNPQTHVEAEQLAVRYGAIGTHREGVRVVVCPPAVFLGSVHNHLPPHLLLGAQDVFWEEKGAHTGEVSVEQLEDLGVSWVIVGHSERRAAGDTDEQVGKKLAAAQAAGLNTILCIGESAEIHAQGVPAVEAFLKAQLGAILGSVSNAVLLTVAYEPIWAISKGGSATPDDPIQASACIVHIKQYLAVHLNGATPRVLYGGSVNAKNAMGFFAQESIDGVLVGSASLDAQQFAGVVAAAAKG